MRYLRYEHVAATARLRLTKTEAANTVASPASFGVEVGHLAYARGRCHQPTNSKQGVTINSSNNSQLIKQLQIQIL